MAMSIEFEKFMPLPVHVKVVMEIAVAGLRTPIAALQQNGWRVRDVLPAPALAARYLVDSSLPLDGLNAGAICNRAART